MHTGILTVAADAPLAEVAGIMSKHGRESLRRAAQMMAEHGVTHLVVLDAASGYPVGVLSTLDVAAAYAGPTAA